MNKATEIKFTKSFHGELPSPAPQVVQHKELPFDWKDRATYGDLLVRDYLVLLENACSQHGEVPLALQRQVAGELQLYFATDQRERAPTVVVNEAMAQRFHKVMRQIMRFVSTEAISSLEPGLVSAEVKHALLSYKNLEAWSSVTVDAYDHDQGLVRLSYYIHGSKPGEEFFVDGRATQPAFAKYRACNFFRRILLRQRIVWLPVAAADSLRVHLDGRQVPVVLNPDSLLASDIPAADIREPAMAKVRLAYPCSKGIQQPLPWNFAGLKARLQLWLARLPWVQHKFARAWVFMDRDIDADDNAEHLYRWVHKHHPEINAWFLLGRNSPDWKRLSSEGFRLVEPGIQRKLLLLNSDLILSSHPEYVFGGFDRDLYGNSMNWRFVFLQHGVIMNDVSHWLSGQPFDLFVTSSPGEHASIMGDDTPYSYTEREMCRSGLPRHDSLLAAAASTPSNEANIVLVMPTWRGALSDDRLSDDSMKAIAASEYVQRWGALLRSQSLREQVDRHGMRLVFMPHPNAVPFLPAFDLPKHVEVLTKADIGIQQLFARSAIMITDFSSVAFEMAYLRRPVIYYHYDFVTFFGGDHNWREGYYDYSNDGFGPRAYDLEQIIDELLLFMQNREYFSDAYLPRMIKALPETDGKACERLFERIMELSASGTV